jgi:two-component system nitrogen regulation response regulator GlnG
MAEIATPTLLVVDDDPGILHALSRFFNEPEVRLLTAPSAGEGLELARQYRPDAILLDLGQPDTPGMAAFQRLRELDGRVPIIIMTGHGTMQTAVEAMRAGALEYLTKPVGLAQLREVVASAFRVSQLMRAPPAPESGAPQPPADVMLGRCAAMQEVFKAIGRVACQDVTVLVLGESGTGKELVARAIYQYSKRADRPFLAINCAAIPEQLLESELFGHEKGAFTGADRQRIGKFEQCNGGTIFLDEIGDMPPLTQAKVLRLLQEQSFERLGGSDTVRTDVRLIAATNKDLPCLVKQGQFRGDLYYRLSVFGIALPPLRERSGDLPVLVEHFLRRFSGELDREVTGANPATLGALQGYAWPGNVRELQSVLKQALLRAHGPLLLPEFLPAAVLGGRPASEPAPAPAAEEEADPALDAFIDRRLGEGSTELCREVSDRVDRQLVSRVLEHTGGNQLQAARILGVTRGKLRGRVRALGINPRDAGKGGEEEDEAGADEPGNRSSVPARRDGVVGNRSGECGWPRISQCSLERMVRRVPTGPQTPPASPLRRGRQFFSRRPSQSPRISCIAPRRPVS